MEQQVSLIAEKFGVNLISWEEISSGVFKINQQFILKQKIDKFPVLNRLRYRIRIKNKKDRVKYEHKIVSCVSTMLPSIEFPNLLETVDQRKPFVYEFGKWWVMYKKIEGEKMGSWRNVHEVSPKDRGFLFKILRHIHLNTQGRVYQFSENITLKHSLNETSVFIQLDKSVKRRLRKAVRNINMAVESLEAGELCFVHADFHPGNIIIKNKAHPSEIGVVDTEWSRAGWYIEDVAYTILFFLRDYRESSFSFERVHFEAMVNSYGLPEDIISILKDYIVLYSYYEIEIFKNLPNYVKELVYQISMTNELANVI